jgi:hypothetical protein
MRATATTVDARWPLVYSDRVPSDRTFEAAMSDKSIPARPNATEAPAVHRQASVRYAPTAKTSCRVVGVVQGAPEPVKILDVSADGVSLLLHQRFDPGTLLAVELSNSDRSLTRLQLVRVVHAHELGTGYVVGGAFANPLSGEEIQALLS